MSHSMITLGSVITFNPRRQAGELTRAAALPYVTQKMLAAINAGEAPPTRSQADIGAEMHYFNTGDVLAANQLIGLQNGRVALVTCPAGFCSKNLLVIRPDPARLDARYLLHFLRHAQMPALVAGYLAGDEGRHPPALNFLRTMRIALPSLPEQRRWVSALDAALARCDTLRRDIAAVEAMRQALFVQLFGDAAALPLRWPMTTLVRQLDAFVAGSGRWAVWGKPPQQPQIPKQNPAGQNALLIRRSNLGCNRMLTDDMMHMVVPPALTNHRTRILAGDVLISTAISLGRSALAPVDIGPAYANQGTAILRSGRIAPAFLAAYLCSDLGLTEIERVQHAGVKPTMNRAGIMAIRLPLPPAALQQQLQQANDGCEGERVTLAAHLTQALAQLAETERGAFNLKGRQRKPATPSAARLAMPSSPL